MNQIEEFYNVERSIKDKNEWVVVFRCPTKEQANIYIEYNSDDFKMLDTRIMHYVGTPIRTICGK